MSCQSQHSLWQQPLGPLILGMIGAQVYIPRPVSWQPLAVGTSQHAFHYSTPNPSQILPSVDETHFAAATSHSVAEPRSQYIGETT